MAKRRPTFKNEEPQMAAFLKQLWECNFLVLGPMADWLEERGDPRANRIRNIYLSRIRLLQHCTENGHWTRQRKWTEWEAVACWCMQDRKKVIETLGYSRWPRRFRDQFTPQDHKMALAFIEEARRLAEREAPDPEDETGTSPDPSDA